MGIAMGLQIYASIHSLKLIYFRCTIDSTLNFIETDKTTNEAVDSKKRRFSFETFKFGSTKSSVYIHAVVKVCKTSEDRYTVHGPRPTGFVE